MQAYLDLLWAFMVVGATTFGGGYAMLPVLERELIKKRGWITMDEVMDYYTIAQITPGIIAVNTATFVGFKRKGVAGGIAATIGLILPGVTLMLLVAVFIGHFAEYDAVKHAFTGIRVAVGALILDTILKLVKGVFKSSKSVVIFALAAGVSVVLSVSPVYVILGAGIAGFVLFPALKNKKTEGSGQ